LRLIIEGVGMKRVIYFFWAIASSFVVGVNGAIAQTPPPKINPIALQYLDQQLQTSALKNAQMKDGSALERLRQYRKAWAKSYPSIASLIGDWSDGIEGSFGIYPSFKSGEVCVLAPFSARIQPGYINGNTISYDDGNEGYDAASIIHDLGREKVIGVNFASVPDSRLIPFFAVPVLDPNSARTKMLEAQGCQVSPPQASDSDGRSQVLKGSFDTYANSNQGTSFTNTSDEVLQYSFQARGTWTYNPTQGLHSAAGHPSYQKASSNYKMPNVPEGALIIRRLSSNGVEKYEYAGKFITLTLSPGEKIWFVMNDSYYGGDNYADNQGQVTVSYESVAIAKKPDGKLIALEGKLKLAANSKQGIQLKNPLSKQVQLIIKTSQKTLWTFDPSKEKNMHDANGYLYGSLRRDQNLLPDVRRGALIVKRNNIAGSYESIGTSANIILEPGEIVTFVMNESTYGTEDYADNKGELQIDYKISESWSMEKPGLKIIPTRKEGFSDEQWDAIEIAVENWNKIISQDKDLSGKLRIVFTSDSKRIDDQTGKEIDWGKVYAKVFEIDKQVGKRVNYDYPNDVDLNEEDYDNRISFNKEWLGGSKPFFLPDACIEGIYPGIFNTKKNMISLAMHEIGHILGLLHPDEAPYIDKAEVNPNESLMKAGCLRRGEKSITDHLIKSLEFQGYKVNRDAIKELKWE
jgi:Matrixin